jgi:hypothetical protein
VITPNLAAHQRNLEAEDVLARDAVLERTRAARVGRRVPADRAELERCGIGRIEQPLLLDRALQRAGDHAGLHDTDEVRGIDLEDLRHLLGRENDAAGERKTSAAHARASAARRDRHLVLETEP